MARIAGFHPAGLGSIPGVGEFIFIFHNLLNCFFFKVSQFDLIKWTVSVPIFDISIKQYEPLNISTPY